MSPAMWVIAAIFGIALLFMAWAAVALLVAKLTDRRMDEHWSSVEEMLGGGER
ncbi:MAG: hypothetical protein H6526_08950 [Actinobacteria bacterium]|nr:hypothetical protein [Actinomycetota bacterium]